jgi:hypothetical protein
MGPFRPDLPAYRLTGTSGIDGNVYVHILAAFVKYSVDPLVSDPFSFGSTAGTDGQGVWFLPMRKAVVDKEGHLHLAYWKQNDLAKGNEIKVDPSQSTVAFPPGQTDSNPIIRVATTSDSVVVHTDKAWRPFPWLNSTKTRKGVVVLNKYFDLDKGLIIEGTIQARALNPKAPYGRKMYAGFYIEGLDSQPGTALLLEVGEPQWRESLIGKLSLNDDFQFESLDVTGKNSATVTGLDNDKAHTFRLWSRGGQMELYIDDLLMQSFFFQRSTGRIGFIAQESEAQFSNLKFYEAAQQPQTATENSALKGCSRALIASWLRRTGFAQATANVEVAVSVVRDISVTLEPESTHETVNVKGIPSSITSETIDTASAVRGGIVGSQDLDGLPLPARSFANIAYLVPGTEPVEPSDPTKARITAVSTGGSSGLNNELSVDGADNSDDWIGGFLQNFSPDGIQEFAVRTSNEDADTGWTTAGSVVITTRHGTNDWHGDGAFYERSSALNARFPIENPAETCTDGACVSNPKQPFSRQNYVGTVGGPIAKTQAVVLHFVRSCS